MSRVPVRWRILIGAFLAVALDTATQILWKISTDDVPDEVMLGDTLGNLIHEPLFQLVGILMLIKLVNWLKLLEFAIEHRIPCVEMGATTYATKILFGGYLERRWLHFRFRSGLWNRVVKPLVPLFDFERNDPELQKLDAAAKTHMGPRLSRLAQRRGTDGASLPSDAPMPRHE